ncbi:EscE/YscE/SsaE family type III secretion system needle protein co-chaperone [Clostridium sp.]|uniref:EscE/YscE/SsaE family type III secretion system needle protein co-chaperone n=1 Tax=Clostridium sp. TaxID=1506 RepID=UPI0026341958|nr:EscE/YscE/SsaE family type III secretion system needle protein co-chaperone [uncultured Clostridium sp.]
MQTKNAKQHVQDVTNHLQEAKNCLTNALSSVEKPENKQQIQNTLNSVDAALQNANSTISNYQE